MKQNELVSAIAAKNGLPKVGIENTLKLLGEVVQLALGAGDDVTLPGIGKLSVKANAARTGRNPRTGVEVAIPAKNSPKFSASKSLKDAVL